MTLFFLLALAAGTLCFFGSSWSFTHRRVRASLLSGLAAIGFLTLVSTEVFSAFGQINALAIQGFWCIAGLVLSFFSWKQRHLLPVIGGHARAFAGKLGPLGSAGIGLLLGLTAWVAIASAPNNPDSLCYHASRIYHWVQQGSVAHYASHVERSVTFPPLAEYLILHLYLLSGHDWWYQLIQWTAFAGSLAAVSLLTEWLNPSPRAFRFSLLFAATIPMVLLQSMTTQNDLLAACWALIAVLLLLEGGTTTRSFAMIAAVMATGFLTKPTFLFFVAPFVIWRGIDLLRTRWQEALRLGLWVGVVMALTAAPFLIRNLTLHHAPMGTMGNGTQNQVLSPVRTVSSVVKQTVLHLACVSPGDRYNKALVAGVARFHEWIGVPLDEPGNPMTYKLFRMNPHEDFSANFVHMWLILFSFLPFFLTKFPLRVRLYWACCWAGFVLFCTLIAYQWYATRLHTTFFLLVAPAIGVVWQQAGRGLLYWVGAVLWVYALPFVLLSNSRPLVSTQWFFDHLFPAVNRQLNLGVQVEGMTGVKKKSILQQSRQEMIWRDRFAEMDTVRREVLALRPSSIGLIFDEGGWDYAYQQDFGTGTLRHVHVQNASAALEDRNFRPDVILSERDTTAALSCHGAAYFRFGRSAHTTWYRRSDFDGAGGTIAPGK